MFFFCKRRKKCLQLLGRTCPCNEISHDICSDPTLVGGRIIYSNGFFVQSIFADRYIHPRVDKFIIVVIGIIKTPVQNRIENKKDFFKVRSFSMGICRGLKFSDFLNGRTNPVVKNYFLAHFVSVCQKKRPENCYHNLSKLQRRALFVSAG